MGKHSKKTIQPVSEPEKCSICLENLTNVNVVVTMCNHKFHMSCINPLITAKKFNCPLCRKHMYMKTTTLRELYNNVKDELFTFDCFLYCLYHVSSPNIIDRISDIHDKLKISNRDCSFNDEDNDELDNIDEADYDEDDVREIKIRKIILKALQK